MANKYAVFNIMFCSFIILPLFSFHTVEGNKMANYGHYQAAIDLFTEAVKLDPRDFR